MLTALSLPPSNLIVICRRGSASDADQMGLLTVMLRLGTALPTFLLSCLLLAVNPADAGDAATLPVDVQAVLDCHCVKCHGPLEQNAGLRLDSAAGVWQGSKDGPIVVAEKPESSKLFRVLAPDADPQMPPKKQLAEGEIFTLRAWIVISGATANRSKSSL